MNRLKALGSKVVHSNLEWRGWEESGEHGRGCGELSCPGMTLSWDPKWISFWIVMMVNLRVLIDAYVPCHGHSR